MTWIELVVGGLACFRLAVLVSDDDGPWRVFQKWRWFLKREAKRNVAVRKSAVHEGIQCLRCSSIWIAAPVAVYAHFGDDMTGWVVAVYDTFLLCMALSAMAILWNRAFPHR